MKSSRKLILLLTILMLASIKATPSTTEVQQKTPDDFSYEDYLNRTEKRLTSYDAPFSPLQRKYIVTLIKLNWYAAYAFCDQNGWSLASIESTLEQFQVQNYLNYFNLQSNHFWTSGNKLADLQNYRWGYNGSKFSYTNWVTGGPNSFMGGQHCVKLQENTLKWDNDFCENSHHFICEMNIDSGYGYTVRR
ncbi:galactose-specific lectin nattectin [Zeugodacus cucurbitae]|uniref:galactose-specific lectin nattectin n=1 Tax=Zeugodacus cucurbitae TaxID=28588 RepID=UPI00059692B4|nr:galactose-specific lectin nattectin [Zeugodacus cucurbitae]